MFVLCTGYCFIIVDLILIVSLLVFFYGGIYLLHLANDMCNFMIETKV